jgi:hypothetical protein
MKKDGRLQSPPPFSSVKETVNKDISVMVLNIRQPGYGREVIGSTVSGHFFLFNL